MISSLARIYEQTRQALILVLQKELSYVIFLIKNISLKIRIIKITTIVVIKCISVSTSFIIND
jgi:hypothetical protein